MVAIHSRGDAGGRETEMRDAGDVREQMKGRVAPGRACERAFYADQQSDRIGYILTLSIDYDTCLP
jgi:hypothetical protein